MGPYILSELQKRGEKVRVLVRDPKRLHAADGVDIVEGDILDVLSIERALEGVDKVIHAAAGVTFWKKEREWIKKVNVEGTANMVDMSLQAGVQKFVHVSSVAALGRSKSSTVINEDAKWAKNPMNTYYGQTKYWAEQEVQRAVQEGLPSVIANPGIIIGPGRWDSGSPKMFKMIAKGLKYYNPGLTGFVPAVDVARATVLLMDSDLVNGERHVLVSDSVPWKQFFGWVAESVNAKAPSRVPPAFVARIAGAISERIANIRNKPPLITAETTRISRYIFNYDGSRICKNLDFAYSDMREIVKQTGAQFLAENGH